MLFSSMTDSFFFGIKKSFPVTDEVVDESHHHKSESEKKWNSIIN
jgi:hypothetical protein